MLKSCQQPALITASVSYKQLTEHIDTFQCKNCLSLTVSQQFKVLAPEMVDLKKREKEDAVKEGGGQNEYGNE